MVTDKLDAEKWAKRYVEITNEVIVERQQLSIEGLKCLPEGNVESMSRLLSELPQLTAGTMGADEIKNIQNIPSQEDIDRFIESVPAIKESLLTFGISNKEYFRRLMGLYYPYGVVTNSNYTFTNQPTKEFSEIEKNIIDELGWTEAGVSIWLTTKLEVFMEFSTDSFQAIWKKLVSEREKSVLASTPATRMPSLPSDEEIEGTPTVYSDRSHIRIYKEGMKFMRDYIKQSLGGVK